ncbi:hypothetical protein [Oscillatoria sp. HE19RPO]|uniref:hypothetical protein n=1 Tax=Oscillatoria sp. HE19RPO TaxID=2954806 RepID=UPI0020C3F4E9|nr:hypothetical protein [Oscillatoria sp. HE19RPO]
MPNPSPGFPSLESGLGKPFPVGPLAMVSQGAIAPRFLAATLHYSRIFPGFLIN